MNETQLVLLHYFFLSFHSLFILFNLFGWIWRKTRKWNFITLMLTLFSWVVLGIWRGFGYCFLTDWHYDVLNKLGETDLPRSYIAYLVFKISGWLPNGNLVDTATIIGITLAVLASVYINFLKKK
ncbi:DUF2784 domain-containing protein [Spongiivirga citrea]|uniref:DUF2784 family protein n=1 Tax=Spongiivirga citrea TaxID=1481457 RepID=A0A6M0CJP9_9FLAO|nr:DUF2784 domain-containing protein [Spongiivirga citrea]NER18175.1 DUF2784 family protein [Spongiivirga citrea]